MTIEHRFAATRLRHGWIIPWPFDVRLSDCLLLLWFEQHENDLRLILEKRSQA